MAFKREIQRIRSIGQGSVTQSEKKIFNVNGLDANDFQEFVTYGVINSPTQVV